MRHPGFINSLRYVALLIASLLALIWGLFAVVSGAQNGAGLIANLPNAAPFLVVMITVYIAFRWDVAGGALLVLFGAASVVFFNAWTSPIVLFGLCVPAIAAGLTLMFCHFIDRPDH